MAEIKKGKNAPKRRGELGLTYNINCGKCGCYGQHLMGISTIGELLADVMKDWEYDHRLGWICHSCSYTAKKKAEERKMAALAKVANMGRFSPGRIPL